MFQGFKLEIKTLLVVAVVAIVVSVGGILLLRTIEPTPSPMLAPASQPQTEVLDTSNWQTYRSDEFGFEVKYPNLSTKGFVVTVNDLVQEYEVHPAETRHPQSQEVHISTLREIANTKVLLNSFQDEQKNHFDVYIGFPDKEEGVNIVFEYPRDGIFEADAITLINQILSTFRFVP